MYISSIEHKEGVTYAAGKKIFPVVEVREIAYPKDDGLKYELVIRYSRRSPKDAKKYYVACWDKRELYNQICSQIDPQSIKLIEAMNKL